MTDPPNPGAANAPDSSRSDNGPIRDIRTSWSRMLVVPSHSFLVDHRAKWPIV
ncbi:hypothetical protein [Nocardia otitidiscaviarum]|uniref:hypothetical protein n=1 Tax=Nocardia otitidiscaviarum TaxID=1823 RepID=UPI001895E6E9|nr:hypothetical protein [Nocardia otitidiscaviarum]MBF6183340.1 hypothetical protein [Nocardia otitidiscaviarum]